MSRPLPPELAAARAQALLVRCTGCGADIGAPCRGLGGVPLQRFAAHPTRLRDAGVRLRPVTPAELHTDTPRRPGPPSPAQAAAQRRAELRADARAGDLTEHDRAELARLDAAAADRQHDPEDTWTRGTSR